MPRLKMTPDQWATLSGLLDTGLELPAAAREAWLEQLDPRFAALQPQLREMLSRAAAVETGDFLDSLPALGPANDLPDGGSLHGSAAPGSLLGPYRLVRELGAGGMGIVWLAERADGMIQRPIALKFPRGNWIRSGLNERLARERDILATLEHPGIARLYDAGVTADAEPYLAMEYVEGEPIDAYCAARSLGIRARIAVLLQVIEAVAYAHSKLVVHRDLKPANILVTADGQVRLLDFGIAKLLDEHQQATVAATEMAGQALTPDYASPEQIAGESLTIASDEYSLGVVLYELLTSRRPYQLKRDSRGALEDAILASEPKPPSKMAPSPEAKQLQGDLDAIVLKALSKSPALRYATVLALGDDLRRHLAGYPVVARPDRTMYRFGRYVSRHKLASIAVTLATVAILAGSGAAFWQARVAQLQANRAMEISTFVTSLFQGVDPELTGAARPLTALDMLARAEQRVTTELASQPELRTELQTVLARSYLGLFESERALAVAERAIKDAPINTPPERAALRSLHMLVVEALIRLARVDEAEQQLNSVLADPDLGPTDPTRAAGLIAASQIAYERGQYDHATAQARNAIALTDQLAARADPLLVMDAHGALGRSAGMQRDVATSTYHAEIAYQRALEIFGGDHQNPRVLDAEQSYAASLIDAARMDEAMQYLERSLASARATYGKESLVAARYGVRLGLTRLERGELDAAIELIERSNSIEARFESGPTPATAGRLRTQARAYLAARRPQDAVAPLAAGRAIIDQIGIPYIALVIEADQAYVSALTGGDINAAAARLERVIKAQDAGERRYKSHLPDYYLGKLLLGQSQVTQSRAALERSVVLARTQTRKAELADALTGLGQAQLAQALPGEAAHSFEEALQIYRSTQVATSPAQTEALEGLAQAQRESR